MLAPIMDKTEIDPISANARSGLMAAGVRGSPAHSGV